MVEVSRRWHRVPQSQREQYQAEAEELQRQYWVDLDVWLRSLSPEKYAAYKVSSHGKGKPRGMKGGPPPKIPPPDLQPLAARTPQEGLGEKAPESGDSSDGNGDGAHAPRGEAENKEHETGGRQ